MFAQRCCSRIARITSISTSTRKGGCVNSGGAGRPWGAHCSAVRGRYRIALWSAVSHCCPYRRLYMEPLGGSDQTVPRHAFA
jgi:hypothetical protein